MKSAVLLAGLASFLALAADLIQVSGECAIYGTRIAGPYTGSLEDIIDRSGKPRRIGTLTLTQAGMETQLKSFLENQGKDIEKFGTSQMQVPSNITIVSADPQRGSYVTVYGYGRLDERDQHDVPIWCILHTK